jgi:hypothetical protein
MGGKVGTFHFRAMYGLAVDEIRERGGITVVVADEGSHFAAAAAICSSSDNYNKKRGREIALGRLRVGGRYLHGKFLLSRFEGQSPYERALNIGHILIHDSRLKGKKRREAFVVIESTRLMLRHYAELGIKPPVIHNSAFDLAMTEYGRFYGEGTGRYRCGKSNESHRGSTK